MSIVRKATVTQEGEIRLLAPEFAGQEIEIILNGLEEAVPFRRPPFGIWEGLGWMAEDFDDPLPEFEPYL
ncbi:hypothetical protein BH11ARM2_BH11ARM2_11770 [soil metagenome]